MSIRQITIIGTGLIGGSFALALKRRGFSGQIVGCDRKPVLERALKQGIIDEAKAHPVEAARASQIVVLATPISGIIDLLKRLGPSLASSKTLITDVGSTKAEIVKRASEIFGKHVAARFLGGHPMAGKEQSGVAYADPHLFEKAPWFLTPTESQNINVGVCGEFVGWLGKIGARIVIINAPEHDRLCAWISHLPQMLSTTLAATLVDEYGSGAPLLETSGRALREMTRIASSPYSIWRDIALTNKQNLSDALLRMEQELAHIRENLDTRELALEFEKAHQFKKFG